MKKCLSLFAVAVIALSLSSCGDNKTKQKIIGVNRIDKNTGGSISAAAAPTVAQAQTYTNTQVAITDASTQVTTVLDSIKTNGAPTAPTAPTNLAGPRRMSMMSAKLSQKDRFEEQHLAFSSDTTTGWYSYTYSSDPSWNYTMRFHLTDSSGNTLTPLYLDWWYEGDGTTMLPIKKYEYEYSGFWDAAAYRTANSLTSTEANPLKRCTYTGSYTMVYVTPGDYTGGVTTNGSYKTIMSYNDGASQTYTTTLTNLSFAYTSTGDRFMYTGGSYSMTYYDWQYYIAFSANGNGSGYCKGPGYNYRITVDGATGEWTFTAQ